MFSNTENEAARYRETKRNTLTTVLLRSCFKSLNRMCGHPETGRLISSWHAIASFPAINWQGCAVLCACSLLTACSYSERLDGGVVVERGIRFGFASAYECSENSGRIQIKHAGLELGLESLSLGFRSTDLVCLSPKDCAAIFFIEGAAQAHRIRELFPDLASACIQPSTNPRSTEE